MATLSSGRADARRGVRGGGWGGTRCPPDTSSTGHAPAHVHLQPTAVLPVPFLRRIAGGGEEGGGGGRLRAVTANHEVHT